MSEFYTILTPLPQLSLGKSIQWPDIKPNPLVEEGLWFSPMEPQLYSSIVKLVKEQKCSDDIIMLLQEAKAIFWAEVPRPWPIKSKPVLSATYYTVVGDAILKRLFACLLLFEYVPKPFTRFFWFGISGSHKKVYMKTLRLLEPKWDYNDLEIKYCEPALADLIINGLQMSFNKLSPILGIKQLKTIFTDENKQKGYLAAGNKNVLTKTEELLKLRYGPDAHFAEHNLQDEMVLGLEASKILHPLSSPKQSIKWCFEGYNRAYFNEIEKLERKLYKEASGQRFIRAFQFFTDAYRLENPHRFVGLMTSLETFFCTTPREITFQLASRIAWFLKPDNFNKRKKLFTDLKYLYNIRSKIVHGGKYSISKVENSVNDLEDLVRSIFKRILSDEKVYSFFFNKDQKLCDNYLEGLNLGQANQDLTAVGE